MVVRTIIYETSPSSEPYIISYALAQGVLVMIIEKEIKARRDVTWSKLTVT